MGGGDKREVSAPSSQFCCQPKSTLKFIFFTLMENDSDLIQAQILH